MTDDLWGDLPRLYTDLLRADVEFSEIKAEPEHKANRLVQAKATADTLRLRIKALLDRGPLPRGGPHSHR